MQESAVRTRCGARVTSGSWEDTVHPSRYSPNTSRRFALGAINVCLSMSAWLVKTRRAPSPHSKDARVYGHPTRAMHKLSTPPPTPAPDLSSGTWTAPRCFSAVPFVCRHTAVFVPYVGPRTGEGAGTSAEAQRRLHPQARQDSQNQ